VIAQENLSRIACIRVPYDTILVSILIHGDTTPTWAGASVRIDELVIVSGGETVHARTDGASHWCAIWFPVAEFKLFKNALTGETPDLPGAVSIWRPPQASRDRLLGLLTAAARAVHRQWVPLTVDQAAHGLEQQLIHALLECLVEPPVMVERPAANRRRNLAARFESLLESWRETNRQISEFSEALGVSSRALQRSCKCNLGLNPKSYLRLHQMHWAHRAIQDDSSKALRVSDLAKRYGFRTAGEFARSYREIFGELPSWSLRGGGPRRNRARPPAGRSPKHGNGLAV
jgi:AraC-like DNA-binding protein